MLLKLKDINKSFDTPSEEKSLTILKNLSLEIAKGETVSIVGPSGSGKSTLLNIIGTLDQPTSGEVFFDEHNLLECSESELTRIRNKEIGFIFQLHHLLPQCTVIENVLIPVLADKQKSNENDFQRAKLLLEKVGLQDRVDYFPAQLSGGELQRVAVVRSLINTPKLILADEPTGSLDNKSSIMLAELLKNIDANITLIIVTHSLKIASMMGKIYKLENGQLFQEN